MFPVAVVLTACNGCEPRATAPGPSAAPVAAPPPGPSATPAGAPLEPTRWCEDVRRASQAIVDGVAAKARRESPDQTTKDAVVPDWCVGGARARWALRVVDASFGPSVSGPWEIGIDLEVAVLVDGREARLAWTQGGGKTAPDAINKLEAVDFDGDGVPELTGIYAPDHPEGVTVEQRWFYRWDKGSLGVYVFPGDAWSDVDADGRMDGISASVVHEHTAWWHEVGFKRVPLLSHQKSDGTFSTDDAVALAFARRTCPARPKDLVVKRRDGTIDEAESSFHIECARLWGVKVDEIKRAIGAACAREPSDEERQDAKPRKGVCLFAHVLRDVAESTKPLLATGGG